MSGQPGTPPRVRVTASRRSANPVRATPLSSDLDEQTELGDVYLEGLMRAQLRLSLLVLAVAALGVGGFAVVLVAVPATRTLSVFGLPFPWLVLGIGFYPAAWLLGRWYNRQAERIESEFADLIGPS